jgi:hypothetical protein
MVKFAGKVGYGSPVDRQNGIWSDEIIERIYYGDVIRDTRRFIVNDKINADQTTGNSISVVADTYANENFSAIRYVEWGGALRAVTEVEAQSPRLILRLGGVYNGPTPTASADSG